MLLLLLLLSALVAHATLVSQMRTWHGRSTRARRVHGSGKAGMAGIKSSSGMLSARQVHHSCH